MKTIMGPGTVSSPGEWNRRAALSYSRTITSSRKLRRATFSQSLGRVKGIFHKFDSDENGKANTLESRSKYHNTLQIYVTDAYIIIVTYRYS